MKETKMIYQKNNKDIDKESFYQTLMDNLPKLILVSDLEKGELKYISDEFTLIAFRDYGYRFYVNEKEMTPKDFIDLASERGWVIPEERHIRRSIQTIIWEFEGLVYDRKTVPKIPKYKELELEIENIKIKIKRT